MKASANLALDAALVADARALGIDVEDAAERGLASAISAARSRAWQAEHADAIRRYNETIEAEGVPLSRYRKF